MIIINSNTRQFNIPGAELVFGVTADSETERKQFQCPRFVGNNLDLASCFIRINYRNANGKTDFYLVDDMVIDGDNITFSWLLSPKVTEYRGQIKFVMCAIGPDLKLKWHTTQGTGQVMEGLEPDNSHVVSQTADVVAQLISMVDAQSAAVEKVGAEQVATIKTATETARTTAVNEIEAKRANSLASIPNDYTILSSTVESLVRDRAGGIVCHAEGEDIALIDSSNQAFHGMRIFGKSTQDGTPTPENPAEIVSVGNDGNVTVMVSGKNILENKATAKTMNGVEFAINADGSITLNGTASADVLITINKAVYGVVPGKSYTISGCPNVNGKRNLYFAQHNDAGAIANTYAFDVGLGATAKILPECKYLWVGFYAAAGTVFSGNTIYPMIRLASVTDATYESYKCKTITTSTPNDLPGIPVTSGGNYTDANGQQWICDEVDFERGVYVQRVGVITTQNLVGKSFALNNGTNSANYNQYTVYGALSGSAAVMGSVSTLDTLKALCNVFPLGSQVQHDVVQESFWIHALSSQQSHTRW